MAKKETIEMVNWLGDMAVQGLTLEPNQSALEIATQFFDELMDAPEAFQGFAANAKNEAANSDVTEIKDLFNRQFQKLIGAGVEPKAALLITGGLETAYTGFALAAQNSDDKEEEL